ncbi:hypothetical protein HV092_17585 [Klebsiella quasipneumoniae]|uniref:hypothetical protein n=1 Tax=Klebsiella quasipneumoniae TaxID=1463165 RepID=UPI0015E5503B|nr:hypothetical protein [Klebsiella quasipneumoniae]QLP59158.1 hypothetical protein HV092_17585 [Klebsiella quasipneumoniae]
MKNKTKNGAAAAEFIPMKDFSNGCADDVLFVRGSADTSSLWEATMSRLTAIKNLLEFGAVALQKTGNINNENFHADRFGTDFNIRCSFNHGCII